MLSLDMDLDLLVLEAGPGGIGADLLRGHSGERVLRPVVLCSVRPVVLPQRTHLAAQNVRVRSASQFCG